MKQKFNSKFGSVFNFTAADLHANRDGVMSANQMQRLNRVFWRNSILILVFSMGFLLYLMYLPFAVERITLAGMVMGGIATIIPVYMIHDRYQKIQAYRTMSYTDKSQIVSVIEYVYPFDDGDDGSSYKLRVVGNHFSLSDNQYRLMKNVYKSQLFEVHYAPIQNAIISIVPVVDEERIEQYNRDFYELPPNVPIRAAELWEFSDGDLKANHQGQFGTRQEMKHRSGIRIMSAPPPEPEDIQMVEGKMRWRLGQQDMLMKKVPTFEFIINGVEVVSIHPLAHSLPQAFDNKTVYRLFYFHHQDYKKNIPLSIEEIQ